LFSKETINTIFIETQPSSYRAITQKQLVISTILYEKNSGQLCAQTNTNMKIMQ